MRFFFGNTTRNSLKVKLALGEGSQTEANAADELSCSPSASSAFESMIGDSKPSANLLGDSSSSANLLAPRPGMAFVIGVREAFGDGRAALLV
jgi:hypothetical protein